MNHFPRAELGNRTVSGDLHQRARWLWDTFRADESRYRATAGGRTSSHCEDAQDSWVRRDERLSWGPVS